MQVQQKKSQSQQKYLIIATNALNKAIKATSNEPNLLVQKKPKEFSQQAIKIAEQYQKSLQYHTKVQILLDAKSGNPEIVEKMENQIRQFKSIIDLQNQQEYKKQKYEKVFNNFKELENIMSFHDKRFNVQDQNLNKKFVKRQHKDQQDFLKSINIEENAKQYYEALMQSKQKLPQPHWRQQNIKPQTAQIIVEQKQKQDEIYNDLKTKQKRLSLFTDLQMNYQKMFDGQFCDCQTQHILKNMDHVKSLFLNKIKKSYSMDSKYMKAAKNKIESYNQQKQKLIDHQKQANLNESQRIKQQNQIQFEQKFARYSKSDIKKSIIKESMFDKLRRSSINEMETFLKDNKDTAINKNTIMEQKLYENLKLAQSQLNSPLKQSDYTLQSPQKNEENHQIRRSSSVLNNLNIEKNQGKFQEISISDSKFKKSFSFTESIKLISQFKTKKFKELDKDEFDRLDYLYQKNYLQESHSKQNIKEFNDNVIKSTIKSIELNLEQNQIERHQCLNNIRNRFGFCEQQIQNKNQNLRKNTNFTSIQLKACDERLRILNPQIHPKCFLNINVSSIRQNSRNNK